MNVRHFTHPEEIADRAESHLARWREASQKRREARPMTTRARRLAADANAHLRAARRLLGAMPVLWH